MGQWAAMRSDEHEQAGKQGVADILYLPLGFPSPCPLCYLPRLPLHLYHCWLQHSSQLPLVHQLPPLAPLYRVTRRLELQPPSWAAMCPKIPAPLTDTSLHAVMTRSTPGPNPVPASARPRTDPRRFIANALRIASRHVTRSRRVHPHDARTRHGTRGP